MPVVPEEQKKESRLRRWIVTPIVNQLKQGTTPEKLSWSISLGIVLGIFPIMGSPSLVCLIVGHIFKLNQAVLHVFKSLTYPLHLALILVFIHLGQKLNGVPVLAVSISEMLGQFKESPSQFARDFGMAALYAIEAWAIVAIFLIPVIRYASLLLLRRLATKKQELLDSASIS